MSPQRKTPTPEHFRDFFQALAKLFDDATAEGAGQANTLLADVNAVIQAAEAIGAPEVAREAAPLLALASLDVQRSAHDWKGFFAALAAFAAQLLPMIIPLFAQPVANLNKTT